MDSTPHQESIPSTTPGGHPGSARAGLGVSFDNSYARLPERFYARLPPTPVAAPKLVRVNDALAESLGLDPAVLASPEGVEMLAGNWVPAGAAPIALAYAGHQFGNFVPQLGDGRAVLLGEIVGLDGSRRDVQLKGAGRTPFSRGGDGRAALGPVLREYIVSEAMAALGVPTTRALAAVLTGEPVFRETVLPGAVLTRIAASHVRVGTFQYFAAREDFDGLRALADYCIVRHYPEAAQAEHPHLALLRAVVAKQAELVAQWLLVGFIHGVMNTDNTAISGETIDYGPCAFLDAYDPATVLSSIDRLGRYAYANQPLVAQWNLARLAEALLPLLDPQEAVAITLAQEVLAEFGSRFEAAHIGGLRRKLGLFTEREGDAGLARDLLRRMADNQVDFTLAFRALGDAAANPTGDATVGALFTDASAFDDWAVGWRRRLLEESVEPAARRAAMHKVNPAFIPRNHLVEAALRSAVESEDFGSFETLLAILSRPYEDHLGFESHALPPRPEEQVRQTFCGT